MYWYFFSQNNWHDGGNSTEQYARLIDHDGMYIHGGKSRLSTTVGRLKIVPQQSITILKSLEQHDIRRMAMFCKPISLFYDYLKVCKRHKIPTVYRCVDDWKEFGKNPWYNEELEKEMIQVVDLAFASSRKMAKKFNIEYLPNACFKVEQAISNKNVVGFMGLVDMDRFDMGLIEYLALAFPNVTFKLIGSKKEWNLPLNVQVYPQTNWQNVYEMSKQFQVGLVLYKGLNLSGMQPIKSWEYLSRGIPQLCAEGLDLPNHESIFTYNSWENCKEQLEVILESSFDKDRMIQFARENTWSKRMERILNALNIT